MIQCFLYGFIQAATKPELELTSSINNLLKPDFNIIYTLPYIAQWLMKVITSCQNDKAISNNNNAMKRKEMPLK